jgi:thiosulfate dehydrogenase [quinone] large subunit
MAKEKAGVAQDKIWAVVRILLGWTFLWAFMDKTFGLGFSTVANKAWILGNSPTSGYLKASTNGPFDGFYHAMIGMPVVDWLFMIGLLGIGLSLILGIYMRFASYSAILLLGLIFFSNLPLKTNPLIDQHIIYIVILYGFTLIPSVGEIWGLGKWWKSQSFVKQYPFLA